MLFEILCYVNYTSNFKNPNGFAFALFFAFTPYLAKI